MKRFMGSFSLVSMVSASVMSSVAAMSAEAMLQGQSLVTSLRQGGYVILIRHAASDKSQKDAASVNVADCSTQRNLSREGRIAAREIGRSIDSLQIPVNTVLSSPYCRAMDTGRFAFGRPETSEALNYAADNNEGKRKAVSGLKPLLSTAPLPKTNTVLISHSTNILATIGFVPEEGEAVIFKPSNNGKYQIVGRVRPEQWATLMPQSAGK